MFRFAPSIPCPFIQFDNVVIFHAASEPHKFDCAKHTPDSHKIQ